MKMQFTKRRPSPWIPNLVRGFYHVWMLLNIFSCVYWHDHMIHLLYLVDMTHWFLHLPSYVDIIGSLWPRRGPSADHAGTLLSRLPALRPVRNRFLLFLSYLVCGICYSRPHGMKTSFWFHWFFFLSFSSSSSFFPLFFMSFICWRKSDICATDLITIWVRLIASLCFILTWTSIPQTGSLTYGLSYSFYLVS